MLLSALLLAPQRTSQTLCSWCQRPVSRLLNEPFHYCGPHHFLTHSAFLYVPSLGKHAQQRLHLQHSKSFRFFFRHSVSFQEFFLDLSRDGSIAERILLQSSHGG